MSLDYCVTHVPGPNQSRRNNGMQRTETGLRRAAAADAEIRCTDREYGGGSLSCSVRGVIPSS